jgi:hypothetical protein
MESAKFAFTGKNRQVEGSFEDKTKDVKGEGTKPF